MTATTGRVRAPRAQARGGKRVAVYTRKSTDKGLDGEFTTLDNQRESVLAYVKSQQSQGWQALPERYDDGGYSGATTDRPAFQRLLEDVRAGRVDIVAVYKIDRVSRSLLDFTSLLAEFERHGVSLVSITEHFDTGSSMGRMTVHLLATFAQFEREMISERTRDKIAASRRKGLFVGGRPPYGYVLVEKKLVIEPTEAARVREMFHLYLRLGTLSLVVEEIDRRGWRTKTGSRWSKSRVAAVLSQPILLGKMTYRDEIHDGQHQAIIDEEIWKEVHQQRLRHGRRGGSEARNKWALLLRGLLRCGACKEQMRHTYSSKGDTRYHYYQCVSHQTPGARCPHARVAAHKIEGFVVEKVGEIGRDPRLVQATLAAAEQEATRKRPDLIAEQRRLRSERAQVGSKIEDAVEALCTAGKAAPLVGERISELEAQGQTLEARISEVTAEIEALDSGGVDAQELATALAEFNSVWGQLLPREQQRLLRLLVEEIWFHGESGDVEIRYRGGLRTAERRKESA